MDEFDEAKSRKGGGVIMEEVNNNSNTSGMTVFPLNNLKNWQERVTKIAYHHGFEVNQRGSNITIWNSGDITPLTYGWRYAQAWRVARESYGKDQSGLGVKSVRVYFQGNEVRPSSVPENVLSKERYNAPNTPEDRIEHALEFGKTFGNSFKGLQEKPVQFEIQSNLRSKTKLICGDEGNKITLGDRHGDVVKYNGFLDVPFDFEILIVSDLEVDSICDEYAGFLSGALDQFGVDGKVRRLSFKDTWRLLDTHWDTAQKLNGKAVLVALDGQTGDGLSSEESKLLEELERRGVGFRMFSRFNRQLRFSCFNQISDLVLVAGGTPYQLELPWPDEMERKPFILGVDLGHPRVGGSILSVVLCDSCGNLIKGWRSEQGRDETADLQILARLLGNAKFEMKRRTKRGENPVLVLRDGRLHKGETVATYRSHLSTKLSFCDLSKRPNTHPFSNEFKLVEPGTGYFPKYSATAYFVSAPPVFAGQMSNLQKVHFPQSWDGLGIGMKTLVDVLVGLSYSPCLGLKPHKSPGPVHWADGFASISRTDCRFRGLGCVESKKRIVKLKKPAKRVNKEDKAFVGSRGPSTGVEGWERMYS